MDKYEGAPEGPYTIATSGDCIGIFNSDGDMIADLTDCSYSKFTAPLFRDAPMLAEQNAKMLKLLKDVNTGDLSRFDIPQFYGKIDTLIAEIESVNGTR